MRLGCTCSASSSIITNGPTQMSSADQDEELTLRIEALAGRMTDYRARFFRPLGPSDIQVARQGLIDIQNMVTDLEGEWRSCSDAHFLQVFQKLGAGKMLNGTRNSLARRRLRIVKRISRGVLDWLWLSGGIGPKEIMVLLNVTRKGYEMLEHVVSLPSYTSHYSDQCSTFTRTSQQSFTRREALEMNASMRLQIERLCSDVNSKQQQISLLNLHSQMVLTSHMRRLNGLLLVLTIGVLIATVLILVARG